MREIPGAVLLALLAWLGSGCAMFFNETEDLLLVTSEPEGARVLLDGEAVGTTPVELSVSVQEHVLEVEREGHVSTAISIDSTVGVEWLVGEVFVPLAGWVMVIVDAATGSSDELETNALHVRLSPGEGRTEIVLTTPEDPSPGRPADPRFFWELAASLGGIAHTGEGGEEPHRDSYDYLGLGVSSRVSLGAHLAESFALCARASMFMIIGYFDPETPEVDEISFLTFSPGVAGRYYLPADLYFDAGVGYLYVRSMDAAEDREEDAEPLIAAHGLRAGAELGRTWWVSNYFELGLGIAYVFDYANDGDLTIIGHGGMLSFSLSYTGGSFDVSCDEAACAYERSEHD